MLPRTMVGATPTSGTSKQLAKLEKTVQAGHYYDAQQMYKTVHARYTAARKYTDSLELLQSGAIVQLKHGEVTCGVELGVLLVDTFSTAKVPYENAIDRIKAIFNEFPRVAAVHQVKGTSDSDSEASEEMVAARTRVEGCITFLRAALKWSIEAGGPSRGAPELHDMLADYIWTQSPVPADHAEQLGACVKGFLEEIWKDRTNYLYHYWSEPLTKELCKASQHFVRGSRPDLFARAVVGCMNECYPGEADLVVARAVLQYLSLGNLRDANQLWDGVKQRLSDSPSQELPDSPLVHFIKFLLLTIERDALPLFRMLRQNYKPSIDRDPTFDEYMDEIGEHFYGLQCRGGMQGMLGDFLKMIAMDS